MTFILGAKIPGKSDDDSEPTGTLRNRRCQSRPLDGDIGRNIVLLSLLGEGSESFQMRTFTPQRETGCPVDRQIGLDSSDQHTSASGHGCAICRSAMMSTLA
jgi:hypothetical protein